MSKYNHKKIEKKWQDKWENEKIYQPDLDKAKNPFYNLMMFPYPSAEGLHVGNMYAFVHSDAYGRFMRLKGYDVFEPIGLDGFGIHAENYAIKIGEHIKEVSKRTEKNFYSQLHKIGNQYDWSRTVETYKPDYYKWTQWLFIQLYKKGLAYRKKSLVNWCPSCKTVLADEQVIDNECERCGSIVEKKEMKQWFFKITDYAEKLLNNLEWIDWSEEVKTIQKNWIGKSEGADINFKIKNSNLQIKVFTTRPDTLFGCTYLVLAPEHNLIEKLKSEIKNYNEVEKYTKEAKNKSELERTELAKEKSGIRLKGIKAINPANDKEIPVFVADYVLTDYGTGAIMAVPAHDQRDYEFAKQYDLPIIEVVQPQAKSNIKSDISKESYTGEGILINSNEFDGLSSQMAKKAVTKRVGGKMVDRYKLRDWCVSRQRYWGPPIPMVECEKCGWVPVLEKDLPVLLPDMKDYLPEGSGKGPLNKVENFVNITCPKCGGPAKRETDVSDPFVDSCWYFMRYPCVEFKEKAFDKKRLDKWMPVDMYIGGKEHSVLHLLYSRFITIIMHELGYAPEEEPFKKFRAHGLLIREGAKMSKSKGNVINPDEFIEKFGADAVRLYLMFLGDMRQGGDWRDEGINGMNRFVNRIWNLFDKLKQDNKKSDEEFTKLLHKTIKDVTEDLENLKFNTAISKLMVLSNKIQEAGCNKGEFGKFLIMLAPFAPHISEELWSVMGNKQSIFKKEWPEFDKKLIKEEEFELVIQVNGKVRDKVMVPVDISEEEAKKLVLNSEKIKKWIKGEKVKKIIYIKNKLVNIVI